MTESDKRLGNSFEVDTYLDVEVRKLKNAHLEKRLNRRLIAEGHLPELVQDTVITGAHYVHAALNPAINMLGLGLGQSIKLVVMFNPEMTAGRVRTCGCPGHLCTRNP